MGLRYNHPVAITTHIETESTMTLPRPPPNPQTSNNPKLNIYVVAQEPFWRRHNGVLLQLQPLDAQFVVTWGLIFSRPRYAAPTSRQSTLAAELSCEWAALLWAAAVGCFTLGGGCVG